MCKSSAIETLQFEVAAYKLLNEKKESTLGSALNLIEFEYSDTDKKKHAMIITTVGNEMDNEFKVLNKDPKKLLTIIKCTFEQLFELFNLGYVHGDLRPANIIVVEEKVYLIDFQTICSDGRLWIGRKLPNLAFASDYQIRNSRSFVRFSQLDDVESLIYSLVLCRHRDNGQIPWLFYRENPDEPASPIFPTHEGILIDKMKSGRRDFMNNLEKSNDVVMEALFKAWKIIKKQCESELEGDIQNSTFELPTRIRDQILSCFSLT